MARPKNEDQSTVASETLVIRLTKSEKAGLEALVASKVKELAKVAPGASISMASLVRGLIARELGAVDHCEAVLSALRELSPTYRRLVPIHAIRAAVGLPKADLDALLLDLQSERLVDLKIANDPTAADVIEHGRAAGIQVADRGLVWYAILP